MRTVTLDIEIYKNYSLFMFKDHESNKVIYVESHNNAPIDRKRLKSLMLKNETITFNGDNYDLPLICAAIDGADSEKLKQMSDDIILNNLRKWEFYKKYNVTEYQFKTIDIKEPSFGVAVSLKLYGGRLNAPKLQDLPIEPSALIEDNDLHLMRKYCENDLDTTWLLYTQQPQQFQLRKNMGEQYNVNLMSKSDAQIAESVFRHELEKQKIKVIKPKVPNNYSFKYNTPDFISFCSPELNDVFNLVKSVDFTLSEKKAVVMPKQLNKAIPFKNAKYKFGIGGLHSQEKKQIIKCAEDEFLIDIDVASFYPAIILGQNLYPKHLTNKFTEIYRSIVNKRLEAKHTGNTVVANSLKIVINGSYGKFGSQYSFLFSPNLLIQTTITGQLALLMLIEAMELNGFKVVSANTDGIVVQGKNKDIELMRNTYFEWEVTTGYDLEETHYKAIYSRDVNNYFAYKIDGEIKGKGCYAKANMSKNPETPIIYQAVKSFMVEGIAIEKTILGCNDITQFLSVKTVAGGAIWKGQYLGKVARWYYAIDGESIHYVKNNNKVGKSDGANPMMDLKSSIPNNLDYQKYIELTIKALDEMGVTYVRE
jgi:DNA polymerase elongation subunit (family B)